MNLPTGLSLLIFYFQLIIWSLLGFLVLPHLSASASCQFSTEPDSIMLIITKLVCRAQPPLPVTENLRKWNTEPRGEFASPEKARGKHFVMLTHYSINGPMGVNPLKADYLFKSHLCFSFTQTFVELMELIMGTVGGGGCDPCSPVNQHICLLCLLYASVTRNVPNELGLTHRQQWPGESVSLLVMLRLTQLFTLGPFLC